MTTEHTYEIELSPLQLAHHYDQDDDHDNEHEFNLDQDHQADNSAVDTDGESYQASSSSRGTNSNKNNITVEDIVVDPEPESDPEAGPSIRKGLSNISPEGTVNERTLLSWNRSFFGALLISLTIVKLFEADAYVIVTSVYFIVLAFFLAVYGTFRYNQVRKYLEHDAYPADRIGPYVVGVMCCIGYILVIVALYQ